MCVYMLYVYNIEISFIDIKFENIAYIYIFVYICMFISNCAAVGAQFFKEFPTVEESGQEFFNLKDQASIIIYD